MTAAPGDAAADHEHAVEPPKSAGRDASPDAVRTRGDLLQLLEVEPAAATPALVRRLKERVEDLYRTDARAARELAECVFLAAERVGDATSLALAHRARGLAALASGSRKDALMHYEAAERLYRLLGDEVERARVLRSMIDALMYLGRYDEALAAAREAREVLTGHGLPVLAAQVDANIGAVYHLLDRNAESLEAFDRALRTFRAAGEEEAVAMMEFNRANVFKNRNELAEAEGGYRRALRWYRASGYRLREAQCLYALAYVAYLRSRYTDALRLFERVRRLHAELGDLRHAALCDLDQAEVLLSLNAWAEAAELGERSQAEFDELGMQHDAAKAVLFRGLAAAHLRRFTEAAILLEDAARRFEHEGNDVSRGLADLYRAELAVQRGDALEAFALAHDAVRAFRREGLASKQAYARVVAARALARLGRTSSARRQCFLGLSDLDRSPSSWVAYQAHHLLGRLEPSPEAARRHLEEALALVERLRARVLPDELRAAFGRDKVRLYEDYVALLLSDPTGECLEDAFGVVELAKSRVLGEYLGRLALEGEGDGPRRARGYTADWRRQLEELNSCYRRLNEAELAGRARSEGEALHHEIADREARLSRLFRTMQLDAGRGAPRRHAGATSAEALVNGSALAASARALLGADEALIEFFFLGEELQAFVLRPDGMLRISQVAKRPELREELERWGFQAEKATLGGEYARAHGEALRAGALRSLDRLGALLWEPLAASLEGVVRLVVVPAGCLFYVPFHALRSGGQFLVQRLEVSTAASARAFVSAHRLRRGRRNPPLVLGVQRPDLPSVTAEVAAVTSHLPGAITLTGAEARRAALRRHGNGARLVHVASHAVFRGDNPLLSSIELADGRLTFYDLFDLQLESDLVVLSGCATGRHGVLEGDELLGLSRGFLYAGTAALVASLWPVRDEATAAFMTRFYRRLEEGGGPRAALAAAMREAIEEGLDPRDWAPFYTSGRPR